MISVVTVVKNDFKGINVTLKSLLSQTFKSFEWIVIDSISFDGTTQFLENLDYNWLKYVSENDLGIYDAMNKGIKLSSGNYLIFLNAGDFFIDKNVLNDINKISETENYDIIYGGVRMCFGRNYYTRLPKNYSDSVLHTLPGHHQATFYKLSLIKEYNFDLNYPNSGDYYMSANLYANGFKNYKFVNRIISEFEVGHNSYQNLFKIWISSNEIQKKILKVGFIPRLISAFKRLVSSFLIIIYFNLSKTKK